MSANLALETPELKEMEPSQISDALFRFAFAHFLQMDWQQAAIHVKLIYCIPGIIRPLQP